MADISGGHLQFNHLIPIEILLPMGIGVLCVHWVWSFSHPRLSLPVPEFAAQGSEGDGQRRLQFLGPFPSPSAAIAPRKVTNDEQRGPAREN